MLVSIGLLIYNLCSGQVC